MVARVRSALLLVALLPSTAGATALRVGPATLRAEAGAPDVAVTVEVEWENAWRNERNHDGVWLFVKLAQGSRRRHGTLAARGHEARTEKGAAELAIETPPDGAGLFVLPAREHRGPVRASVRLSLDRGSLEGLDLGKPVEAAVHGLEMVLVPRGPFALGDLDPKALEESGFYRSGGAGKVEGTWEVASEAAIPVGVGRLDYRVRYPEYEGDRMGPIPAEFPKGFAAFWVMKYELSQGEYATFWNSLPDAATYFRAIHAGRGYASGRGSIAVEEGRAAAKSPRRPANWVSWEDGCGFADWAGLRPITELEWEKAARGPEKVAGGYVWGTASRERLRRVVRADDELETSGEADEGRLTNETRDVLGASYYWVMDLSGSVWERVVTAGHPLGRAFRGTHGDGRVSGFGKATNADWPNADSGSGGYGYRGGGHYERGFTPSDLNPTSPLAWRRYAAWGEAPRSIAYGFRAGRTAYSPPASEAPEGARPNFSSR